MWLCHVGYTSSHLNTDLSQDSIWMGDWETVKELLVLLAWVQLSMLHSQLSNSNYEIDWAR